MNFGLLGFPLGHSFSEKYFTEKFSSDKRFSGWTYKNFQSENIETFLNQYGRKLDGFNVTIPYKTQIIPYLDNISDEAREIGAVNCVKNSGGNLIGYNTDAMGFKSSLLPFLNDACIEYALILGSGGASKAIRYVLKQLNINYDIVSRSGEINYGNIDLKLKKCRLIVNTTPLGMYPAISDKPDINYNMINNEYYLYDLVYNPEKTAFLKEGEIHGCHIKSGTEMLYLQADKSLQIWIS